MAGLPSFADATGLLPHSANPDARRLLCTLATYAQREPYTAM